MKINRVEITAPNPVVQAILTNPAISITVDANIFIPPDRSKENEHIPSWSVSQFREIWLVPILQTFPNISMHESVYAEILGDSKVIVDQEIAKVPPGILLLKDNDLNPTEQAYRNAIEKLIAVHTAYNPTLNNSDDRGEVKSLAYMATRNMVYFCSHDNGALRLIDEAVILQTSLDSLAAVRSYEIILLLIRLGNGDPAKLRHLYKYLYYLTKSDKKYNASWDEFRRCMDDLYP